MKTNIKKFAFGFGLIVAVSLGIYLLQNNHQVQPVTSIISEQNYNNAPLFPAFVEGWNNKVRSFHLSEDHLLSSTDGNLLIKQIKTYIDGFTNKLPKDTYTELVSISQTYPNSIWTMYSDFLTTYTGKKTTNRIVWATIDSSIKLNNIILKTVQSPLIKRDLDESIKLLLAASDPCAYFSIYKVSLWKHGLSKNFRVCNRTIIKDEKAKYPNLYKLIK